MFHQVIEVKEKVLNPIYQKSHPSVYGWLLFYHAVGTRKGRKCYSIGCALLDIENPCKILYRCDEPIFTPREDYELYGWAPNVTVAYGAVVKGKDSNEIAEKNDEIIVSYGGGDRFAGLFTVKLSDIIPEKIKEKIKEKLILSIKRR